MESESDSNLSTQLSKEEVIKNEEIKNFDNLINTFKNDQVPVNMIYIDIFRI